VEETGAYYDRLTRWTGALRLLGYGGGRRRLTVHRALADPRAGGRPTVTRLHDLILDALPLTATPRILDAGCGFGGTLIDFGRRLGGLAVGVTLSDAQAAVASRAIAAAGLGDRVRVEVRSYDHPPPGPFDVVIAIESLAHSPHPPRSLEALSRVLVEGGLLVVVDDMPLLGAADSADLAAFKHGWRCPVLMSREAYARALAPIGMRIVADHDLSGAYRPRTLEQIARLERLNRLARAVAPSGAWRQMLDSYRGGLALERMYRRGVMQYRLMIARRST
jgi:tocopherol O-methyltransferase